MLRTFADLSPDTFDGFHVSEYVFNTANNGGWRRYCAPNKAPGKMTPGMRALFSGDVESWPKSSPGTGDDGFESAWTKAASGAADSAMLLITGSFSTLGGVRANGAAIALLRYSARTGTDYSAQYEIIPLDIGKVRNACAFRGSVGVDVSECESDTPRVSLSHLLVEFES